MKPTAILGLVLLAAKNVHGCETESGVLQECFKKASGVLQACIASASIVPKPKGICVTCYDLLQKDGSLQNGVYNLSLWDSAKEKHVVVQALCDMAGGGFTVIAQMLDGNESFTRNWTEYAAGFGPMAVAGSFWWGLDKLHLLSHCAPSTARFVLTAPECNAEHKCQNVYNCSTGRFHADYAEFQVGSAASLYKLNYTSFLGHNMTGNPLSMDNLCPWGPSHGVGCPSGMSFSTIDSDNDNRPDSSCATGKKGGWWYNNCGFTTLTSPYVADCPQYSSKTWYPAISYVSSWSLNMRPSTAAQ